MKKQINQRLVQAAAIAASSTTVEASGAELKRKREGAKLTQRDVAKALKVTPQTISCIEREHGYRGAITILRYHALLNGYTDSTQHPKEMQTTKDLS